jgi:pimeloyl-ACP methyl ester carboxylesterase
MNAILYLHGFASSPRSKKAQYFAARFAGAGAGILVPELATEGIGNLTITGQLRAIERAAGGRAVSLIGSSLGGYLAALYAARHPEVEKLVLLAPAFGFARRWAESLGEERMRSWQASGSMSVMDYATGQPAELGWQFMEDARAFEEEPAIAQPCLIYHGTLDDVVPLEASRSFAAGRSCVELREMDSGHELLNVLDEMWAGTRQFLLG